jgi:hypothetical protein
MNHHIRYRKPPTLQLDTLKQRLKTELGSPAQIDLKGRRFCNTVITGITDTFMRAGSIFVPFHRASVITLGKTDSSYGYETVKVDVKAVGTFEGILIRSGIDYIELEADEVNRVVRRVIPLNRYVFMEPVEQDLESLAPDN